MFLRAVCVIAFFGLLNQVHSATSNPEELKEQILAAQEEATVKVLTASLKIEEASKLNYILEIKANDYYNAAVDKNDYKLKVELVRKITDSKKTKLENKVSRLAGKTHKESQANLALAENIIGQIEEMEKVSEQQIANLTEVELAAKLEWETFDNETQSAVAEADQMKKEAVKAVVKALELTATSTDLVKKYPSLTPRDAAQKACVDYFKNRLEELAPGLSDSFEFYESMKKIWIKGQKEFVKSAA